MWAKIKLIVFDIMSEYGKLLRIFPKGECLPIRPEEDRDNLFECPPGVDVESWIEKVVDLLREFWFLRDVSCNLLREILYNVYRSLGWLDGRGERYPTMIDIVCILRGMEYKPNTRRGEAIATLLNRFSGLGPLMKTFGCEKGFPLTDMYSRSIDYRVGGLSDDHRLLYTGLKLLKFSAWRERLGEFNYLEYLFVIEEAHKFCSPKLQKRTDLGEPSIFNWIRTLRKRGAAMVLLEQVPGTLPLALLGNINTKIVLRLSDAYSIARMAQAMTLTEEQAEKIATLPFRTGILQSPDYPSPVLFQVEEAHFEPVPEEEIERRTKEILGSMSFTPGQESEGLMIDVPETDSEERGWVKVKETHGQLLKDVVEFPLDGMVERQKRLSWNPWFLNKQVSELVKIKFLEPPVSVNLGVRGNVRKCLRPTAKGCGHIKVDYESTKLRGRGTVETQIIQRLMFNALKESGKNVLFEFNMGGKSVDVCEVLPDGGYRAYEFESEPNEHAVHNAQADLKAGFSEVVVVTRNRNEQNEIKTRIYRELEFGQHPKVKFQLLKELLRLQTAGGGK